MKVSQIHIKHPVLGEIVVNGTIKKKINEQIGDVTEDFSREPNYYYADITKNDDGTFFLERFGIIKPVSYNIGWMDNSKGIKNFIQVISNVKAGDDIMIYPSAVLSVTYTKS